MTNRNTNIVKASEKRVLENNNKDTKIKNRKLFRMHVEKLCL